MSWGKLPGGSGLKRVLFILFFSFIVQQLAQITIIPTINL